MNDDNGGGADVFVETAKAAIRAYVKNGEHLTAGAGGIRGADGAQCLPPGLDIGPLLGGRAGVFVSIKKLGSLRGCIGTISPFRGNLAEEIIYNAVNACGFDPRFPPVGPEELADLTVSVDVLAEAEPVDSTEELDVNRYGVIVSKGYRRGLLLPNLEGVDTVEYQLQIALSKAGIRPNEKYGIERFEVVRHELGGRMGGE